MTTAADRDTRMLSSDEVSRFVRHRFSWGIAFAGAAIATAVSLLLLALGSGVGLTLVRASQTVEPAFLTLGAVYFFAAQAFGFAVGGHIAGRLIGPAPESAQEEDFRATAHGLVVWAIGAVGTAIFVAITGWVVLGAGLNGTSAFGVSNSSGVTSAIANYWADMLFRPPVAQQHASIAWQRYAQADTGVQTDAGPAPEAEPMQPLPAPEQAPSPQTMPPSQTAPAETNAPPSQESQPASGLTVIRSATPQNENEATTTSSSPPPRNIGADKAEVARILEMGFANGARLNASDKQRIANLIIADAGLGPEEAMRRVNDADQRLHDDASRAAEFARKAVRNASLWIAFALLFGAIVAAAAAVSARWTDDRVTFRPGRREPI